MYVQVVRAYEILSDEARRADYDRHGHRGQNMDDEVRHERWFDCFKVRLLCTVET